MVVGAGRWRWAGPGLDGGGDPAKREAAKQCLADGQGGQPRRRQGRHPGGGQALPGRGRHRPPGADRPAAGPPGRGQGLPAGGQGGQPRRRPARPPAAAKPCLADAGITPGPASGTACASASARSGRPTPTPPGDVAARPLRTTVRECHGQLVATDLPASVSGRSAEQEGWISIPRPTSPLSTGSAAGLLRYLRAVAPGAAEDLAADVWVEVAASAHRFQGDTAAFRGWIYTIARRG